MRDVANWIFDENLAVFLDTMGYIVGYHFDPAEVDAIKAAVRKSDGDAELWFNYPVAGCTCACELRLALDYGSSVIQVRISLPELQGAQAEVAIYMCQCFNIRTDDQLRHAEQRAPADGGRDLHS